MEISEGTIGNIGLIYKAKGSVEIKVLIIVQDCRMGSLTVGSDHGSQPFLPDTAHL